MTVIVREAVSNTRRNVIPDFQSLTSKMIEKEKKKEKKKTPTRGGRLRGVPTSNYSDLTGEIFGILEK